MIFIFSPPPQKEKIDGYFARVKEIDKIFGENDRIYIEVTGRFDHFKVASLGAQIWHLKIGRFYANTNEFWNLLNQAGNLIYFHSIYNFAEVSASAKLIPTEKTIIDMHGAVPEELKEEGSLQLSHYFEDVERKALNSIRKIIVVSRQMQKHLQAKYSELSEHCFILLPILKATNLKSDASSDVLEKKKKELRKPSIAYVGGMQKWQKIDKVIDCIKKHSSLEFKIFSKDFKQFQKLIGAVDNISKCAFISEEQLQQEYKNIHYSLILRDDHVLNRVSCPTKMIDTISNSAVPILDSANIGDFVEMGLQFLPFGEIGKIAEVSPEKYQNMLINNQNVLQKLKITYESGRQSLLQQIPRGNREFAIEKFLTNIRELSLQELSQINIFSYYFLSLRIRSKLTFVLAKLRAMSLFMK